MNNDYCLGEYNTGVANVGSFNSGEHNLGDYNSGIDNVGMKNTGSQNYGDHNAGNFNVGNSNVGGNNCGNCNVGDWNKADNSLGCFNTKQNTINMFNKPSNWTLDDWKSSNAYKILAKMPKVTAKWVWSYEMTKEEITNHPEYAVTGGMLRIVSNLYETQQWWDRLPEQSKSEILNLPNFDKGIFKEITNIVV